jgi:Holliday junction resolvasome RuvABC endonuclease subunit
MSTAETSIRRERYPVLVFGADPGLANFGYAVVRLFADRERIISVDVISTAKSDKKLNVLAANDNHRRTVEVFSELHRLAERYRLEAAAAESASWPRNASSAAKVALSWGALSSVVTIAQVPLSMASPQRIKKCLCGSNKASKKDVREALLDRYPGEFDNFMKSYPKTLWEHGFDAVGAVVACLDSEVFKMARRRIT